MEICIIIRSTTLLRTNIMDGYVSPKHKLLKLFKDGRDNWKEKHAKEKKRIKYLKNRVHFLEESKASLKNQVSELKQKLKEQEFLLKNTESKKKL